MLFAGLVLGLGILDYPMNLTQFLSNDARSCQYSCANSCQKTRQ